MASITPLPGTTTAFAWTMASKASDTNLLAGFESTSVALSGFDAIIGGKITTGTTPTAGRMIQIFAYGSYDDTEYSAGAAGTDGALTVTAESKTLLRLVTIIPTNATSDTPYRWGPFYVSSVFDGLVVPEKFGLWFVHNTGVNLNATGSSHEAFYTLINVQSS